MKVTPRSSDPTSNIETLNRACSNFRIDVALDLTIAKIAWKWKPLDNRI